MTEFDLIALLDAIDPAEDASGGEEAAEDGASPEQFARAFLGTECHLLRNICRQQELADRIFQHPNWQEAKTFFASYCAVGSAPDRTTLAARQFAIQAALASGHSGAIAGWLRQAIETYNACWWGEETPRPLPPAVLKAFDAPAQALNAGQAPSWTKRIPPELAQLFADLAGDTSLGPSGWLDPALNLVGETVAQVWTGREPTQHVGNAPVSTWVLLQIESPLPLEGQGLAAKLRLWRIPGGNGYFYPDPHSAGHLQSDASFQESLQTAWYAAVMPDLEKLDFDIAWSLEILHPYLKPFTALLKGRSAEAALACAIRALLHNPPVPLDEHTAITAQFEQEWPHSNRQLMAVEGIKEKLQANEFDDRLNRTEITELVLHNDQQPGDDAIGDAVRQVHRVANLQEAYDRLSRWSVMSWIANEAIAAAALRELHEKCRAKTATHYIESRLLRDMTPEERQQLPADQKGHDQQETVPLGDGQQRQIINASNPDHRRVCLFADSGVGKSTLLRYCEHKIASAQTGQVPILLDKLAGRAWRNPAQFDDELANSLRLHFPDKYKKQAAGGQEDPVKQWLQHLRDDGQLVFLLDALDQATTASIKNLAFWLTEDTGGIGNCRVYVTGRPWTRRTKDYAELFQSPRQAHGWLHLEVDRLTPEQVDEFLGKPLADRFRQVLDEEVLSVPMICSLLMVLEDSPSLGSLVNRERVYQAAVTWREMQEGVQGLIERGLHSQQDQGRDLGGLNSVGRLASVLARAAWEMFLDPQFTGYVEGKRYDAVEAAVDTFIKDQHHRWKEPAVPYGELLKQVNLLSGGIYEHAEQYLEWRHLSICEYFAGVYLAEEMTADQQHDAIAELLDMVRSVREARLAAADGAENQGGIRSPRDRWQWVFRFALCRAFANQQQGRHRTAQTNPNSLNDLARLLMQHGDPYVVYDCLTKDHIKIDDKLDRLCRWLVHQTWSYKADYQGAWKEGDPPPDLDAETIEILAGLFDRRYRNGPALPPAWQLLESAVQGSAATPQTKQLGERAIEIQRLLFGDAIRSEQDASPGLTQREHQVLQRLRDSFVACPADKVLRAAQEDQQGEYDLRPGDTDGTFVFRMGAGAEDDEAFDSERPQHAVQVQAFELATFCVTNDEFELLDPSHYWWRDEYSSQDDQPALYVNWHMADFFGRVWLSGLTPHVAGTKRHTFRLPTECEWEFAARAGRPWRYWWGDKFNAEKCNSSESSHLATLGRSATTPPYHNDFDLAHMLGNNWQWCGDFFDGERYQHLVDALKDPTQVVQADAGPAVGSSRVLRGGSFNFSAARCRCSFRYYDGPSFLRVDSGFRLLCSVVFPESSETLDL